MLGIERHVLGGLIGLLISIASFGQGVDHWRIGNPYVSRCDAAFSFSADYGALISNRQMLFEPMVNVEDLHSTTALVPANLFPSAYDARPISAALEVDEQTFLLFKGNIYVPMDKATLQAKGKAATWTGWPGYWKNDIDAALQWPDGAYVFIKGFQYVSYDPRSGATSRTGQLNQWAGWPSSWTGSIEAAFNGQDGYLYFIRKGEILAMDATTMAMAPGYPRRLAGEKSGVNMAGTDAWAVQPEQTTTQAEGGTTIVDVSSWCSVGIPDASTAPAGGNITPMQTDLAGGKGGEGFSDKLVRGTRVKEVRVWAMNMIQAIEIVTESPEKFVTEGGPKGSALGSPKVFELAAGECILGIEGTWGGPSGESIHTLRFITNKRKSPLYGGLAGRTGEKEFRFEVPPEGAFSGFHGRSSRFLDALGIQYNIYQYVVFDADGKLIETAGDKTAWNSGTQVQDQQAEGGEDPDDPWFDDHLDITDTDKQEGLFLFTTMPGTEAVGRSVDITKIDPWDLSVDDGRANSSPLVIISDGSSRGSGSQKWFFPHGYNRNTSGQLASGRSKESVKIMKSFKEYTEEFGIQVGAEFQVTGVAAGSANVSHKKRRTTAIGKTKVMISKTYDIYSHSCNVDLDWVDKKSGQKKRQKLDFTFREMVKALEVPGGKVPDAKIEDLVQNGPLPSGLDRIKGPYDALIAEFGTHFINNIQFGGYYTMWSELEEDEISTSKMTETDVKASFSAGSDASPGGGTNSGGVTIINNIPGQGPEAIPGTSGSAGGSVGVNASSSQSGSETNSTLEIEINASGGGGKITRAAWEADVKEDPVVRDAQFRPISDLLSPVFFPTDAQIEKKAQMLRLAIKQHIRNSAEILAHSDMDSITFSVQADKDQAATAQQAADLEKPVKLEVELIRMKCSAGDEEIRDDNDLELYGNMELTIVDDQLDEVMTYTTLDRSSDNPYNLTKGDKYQELNEVFTVTTTKGKLDHLQIVVWGNVTDEDPMDSDDDLLKISSFADGQPESLPRSEGIGKPSAVKTISVAGEKNTVFTLMIRVKQIE
jgi:hypothetical protein